MFTEFNLKTFKEFKVLLETFDYYHNFQNNGSVFSYFKEQELKISNICKLNNKFSEVYALWEKLYLSKGTDIESETRLKEIENSLINEETVSLT